MYSRYIFASVVRSVSYQSTPELNPQQADELGRRVAAGEVRREVARAFGISVQ